MTELLAPHVVTAAPEGRFLRLSVDHSDSTFRVRPLSWKRGRVLAARFVRSMTNPLSSRSLEGTFAEALGTENYARITGDHVQEFDELGSYLRTVMPGAVMVESIDIPPSARPGELYRIVSSPWSGMDLRYEEIQVLGLCALLWQTVGWEALRTFLTSLSGERPPDAVGLALALLVREGPAVADPEPAPRPLTRRLHEPSSV